MKLYVDIETFSNVPLLEHGTPRYADSPHSGLLCLCYAIDDQPVQTLDYWEVQALMDDNVWAMRDSLSFTGNMKPGAFLAHWLAADEIVAHGAQFEYWWLLVRLRLRKFLKVPRWIDTMAQFAYYGYPRGLGAGAKALGCKSQKDAKGKWLIDLLCKGLFTPDEKPQEFQDLYSYCGDDVETMREAHKLLPPLPEQIQERWEVDHEINLRGMPLDLDMIRNAVKMIAPFKGKANAELAGLTAGAVTTVGQIEKIKAWLKQRTIELPDLQADTVTRALHRPDLTGIERRVLEIRQEAGLSSLSKYQTILDYQLNGRLYYMIDFFGAHTMRPTGHGPQVLNLARANENSDFYADVISKTPSFLSQLDAPLEYLKTSIRGVICADDDHMLLGYDLAQIEARAGAWAAMDDKFLALFDYSDPYCTHGERCSGKKLTKKDNPKERNVWKANVLSMIFAGGIGAHGRALSESELQMLADIMLPQASYEELREAEQRWKFYIDKDPVKPMTYHQAIGCDIAKQRFRREFPILAAYWKKLEEAFKYGGTAGRVLVEKRGDLRILTLPSGRQMFYHGFTITSDGRYSYMGRKGRYWIWRGVLMENVAQCINADVSDWYKVRVNKIAPIIHHCYDEATMEVLKAEAEEKLAAVKHLTQTEKPEWADGLPLGFDYWIGRRYGK